MAEKKLRKFALWKLKWFLLYGALKILCIVFDIVYVAIVIFMILALIGTVVFIENNSIKTALIIYEVAIILVTIGTPILANVAHKKESKKEIKHTVSKEEFNQYVEQAKRCDIHAK